MSRYTQILFLFLLLFTTLYFYQASPVQAQNCTTTSDRSDGLISIGDSSSANIQGFSNPWMQCATGAAFSPFAVINFAGLWGSFYQNESSSTTLSINKVRIPPDDTGLPANFTEANINGVLAGDARTNQLLSFGDPTAKWPATNGTGNLAIGGPIVSNAANPNQVVIVFVYGELDINSNICYGNPPSTPVNTCGAADPNNNSKGLIFVVSGPINIDASVTQINAMLISSNDNPNPIFSGPGGIPYTICTYFFKDPANPTNPPCPLNVKVFPGIPVNQRLIVYGNLISLNSTKTINFRRNLSDNSTEAAESVITQPKFFALLRNVFTIPEAVTTENTHFSEQL